MNKVQYLLDAVLQVLEDRRREIVEAVGEGADTAAGCLGGGRSELHRMIVSELRYALQDPSDAEPQVHVVGLGADTMCQWFNGAIQERWPDETPDDVCARLQAGTVGDGDAILAEVLAALDRQCIAQVLAVGMDAFGEYRSQDTTGATEGPAIRLFWLPIVLMARDMNHGDSRMSRYFAERGISVDPADLAAVVLAHFWARALTKPGDLRPPANLHDPKEPVPPYTNLQRDFAEYLTWLAPSDRDAKDLRLEVLPMLAGCLLFGSGQFDLSDGAQLRVVNAYPEVFSLLASPCDAVVDHLMEERHLLMLQAFFERLSPAARARHRRGLAMSGIVM